MQKRTDFSTIMHIVKKWYQTTEKTEKQPQSPEFLFVIYDLSPIWQVILITSAQNRLAIFSVFEA